MNSLARNDLEKKQYMLRLLDVCSSAKKREHDAQDAPDAHHRVCWSCVRNCVSMKSVIILMQSVIILRKSVGTVAASDA